MIEAYVIDDINILQASLMAMRDAVLELSLPPDYLLIDGRHKIPLIIPQETIIQGDSRSLSIAAASIIAKVSRDRIMEIYHRQFPQYNFLKNKGFIGMIKFMWSFLPEAWMMLVGGFPKLILLVEFAGTDENVVNKQCENLKEKIKDFKLKSKNEVK